MGLDAPRLAGLQRFESASANPFGPLGCVIHQWCRISGSRTLAMRWERGRRNPREPERELPRKLLRAESAPVADFHSFPLFSVTTDFVAHLRGCRSGNLLLANPECELMSITSRPGFKARTVAPGFTSFNGEYLMKRSLISILSTGLVVVACFSLSGCGQAGKESGKMGTGEHKMSDMDKMGEGKMEDGKMDAGKMEDGKMDEGKM